MNLNKKILTLVFFFLFSAFLVYLFLNKKHDEVQLTDRAFDMKTEDVLFEDERVKEKVINEDTITEPLVIEEDDLEIENVKDLSIKENQDEIDKINSIEIKEAEEKDVSQEETLKKMIVIERD